MLDEKTLKDQASMKILLMLVSTIFIVILSVLAVFATIMISRASDSTRYENTVNVSGYGEVDATPDIAMISFTVEEEGKEAKAVGEEVNKKMVKILDELESLDIDEKDIKTQSFNVQPKYEYRSNSKVEGYYPPQNRVQVGVIVSQYVSVKVRETDNAGSVIAAVNNYDVKYLNGPSFQIDDIESVREEAKSLAIEDAKEKAKKLAKDLDARLGDLISYHENGGGYPRPYMVKTSSFDMGIEESAASSIDPVLPVGENTISANVTLIYELK